MVGTKISGDMQGCGSISFLPTVYAENCTSTTNAKCSCRKGFLCSNEDCSECEESKCPAGEQMKWTGRRVSLRSGGNMLLLMKDIDRHTFCSMLPKIKIMLIQYLDTIFSVFIHT